MIGLNLKLKPPVLLAILMVFSFIISLILFFVAGDTRVERIMIFPDSHQTYRIGEVRYLPRQKEKEENIEKFISELILGPQKINYLHIFPAKTKLKTTILRNNVLYIDFNEEILFQNSETPLNFSEMISMLKENLNYNFHYLKKIIITVNGEIPFIAEAGEQKK